MTRARTRTRAQEALSKSRALSIRSSIHSLIHSSIEGIAAAIQEQGHFYAQPVRSQAIRLQVVSEIDSPLPHVTQFTVVHYLKFLLCVPSLSWKKNEQSISLVALSECKVLYDSGKWRE